MTFWHFGGLCMKYVYIAIYVILTYMGGVSTYLLNRLQRQSRDRISWNTHTLQYMRYWPFFQKNEKRLQNMRVVQLIYWTACRGCSVNKLTPLIFWKTALRCYTGVVFWCHFYLNPLYSCRYLRSAMQYCNILHLEAYIVLGERQRACERSEPVKLLEPHPPPPLGTSWLIAFAGRLPGISPRTPLQTGSWHGVL